jgi:hypothetical protein
MSQEHFAGTVRPPAQGGADFSCDTGALAYAQGQLDQLVAAMRFKLEKHLTGWPGDDRELDTYEALRHLLRDISFGHAAYMEADYRNPTLTKMSGTSRIQFQLPSPDCVYHAAILHGDYRYRLTGNRGSARIFQQTVYRGHACNLIGWKTHSVVNNFDDPRLAPGRNIDLVLSRTRPTDLGDAVWLPLPEGPCELHSRQYYGDWEREQPADLLLAMDGQRFPAELLERTTSETRFNRLIDLLRVHSEFYRAGVQAHLDADPHEIAELVIPGAFEGTNYFPGHFRCDPQQAVIIEIEDPGCLYWNTALFQMQYEPGDWWARAGSYNSTQVHTDADGKVRLIASWQDPGVPNWLDASGRKLHLIAFRFFRAPRVPPKPRLRLVPFDQLHGHLPADTPRVTPAARHELLRRRLISVYERRCGDF